MGISTARWCLQPVSQLEILVVPRKEWNEAMRPSSLSELKELTAAKAAFFQARSTSTYHLLRIPTYYLLVMYD